jgi:hypothetical protein
MLPPFVVPPQAVSVHLPHPDRVNAELQTICQIVPGQCQDAPLSFRVFEDEEEDEDDERNHFEVLAGWWGWSGFSTCSAQ